MADKHLDGIKAAATKVAQYGPTELKRAGDQAAWTKRYANLPKSENPFLRSKVYTAREIERAKQFRAWKHQNPAKDDSENPFCWRQP
jgi:hypothetical protein